MPRQPLVLGQFVKLKLIGPEIKDICCSDLRFSGHMDTILVLDQDNRLKFRKVKTIKKDGVEAWVSNRNQGRRKGLYHTHET